MKIDTLLKRDFLLVKESTSEEIHKRFKRTARIKLVHFEA